MRLPETFQQRPGRKTAATFGASDCWWGGGDKELTALGKQESSDMHENEAHALERSSHLANPWNEAGCHDPVSIPVHHARLGFGFQ